MQVIRGRKRQQEAGGSALDVLRQDREAIFADFGEAAAHFDRLELRAFGAVDLHRAVANRRHDRGVALEHAELALGAEL